MALRAATRRDHDRVDAAFTAFDLADPKGYVSFLQSQYLAHAQVEAWLAVLEVPAGLRWPERSASIAGDLRMMDAGLPPLSSAIAPPSSGSIGFATGVLYCLAGATFGARVLIQRIPENAQRAFLTMPLPAGYWQRLVAELDRVSAAGQLGAAKTGAKCTFALFSNATNRIKTAA